MFGCDSFISSPTGRSGITMAREARPIDYMTNLIVPILQKD